MVLGFWTTGTIKLNRITLSQGLSKAERKAQRADQGNLVIRMHRYHQMCFVSWQDAKLVTMVSTVADAWEPSVVVMWPKKGRAIRQEVLNTPVHIQYQEFMRGIDVTDQLRTYYSI